MIEHLKNKATEKTDWGDGGSYSHRSGSRGVRQEDPQKDPGVPSRKWVHI